MKVLYSSEVEGCEQDTVSVAPWEFLDGKVWMELPSGFMEMEAGRRNACFPYEKRPDTILEDRDGDVRLTLQFLENGKGSEDVYSAAYGVSRLVGEAFPQYGQSPVHLSEEGGLPAGWFLLHMRELKAEHMKVVFLPERGALMLLTVTYPEGECVKWREVCRCIRESVRIQGDGRETGGTGYGKTGYMEGTME